VVRVVKKRHRDLVVVNPPLKLAQPMVWILSRGRCGRFSHRVVTSGEIISAILMGQISTGAYMKWLLNATSGNIVGGVVIVSVLNYGQVRDI
jgi:formate/nitrite transporter FocA (FNT family)